MKIYYTESEITNHYYDTTGNIEYNYKYRFVSLFNGTIGQYRDTETEVTEDGQAHQRIIETIHNVKFDHINTNLKKELPELEKLKLCSFEDFERDLIKLRLKYFHGDITKAAKSMKLSRTTIYRKMEKYGIENDFRE